LLLILIGIFWEMSENICDTVLLEILCVAAECD